VPIEFHVSETPCFLPKDLIADLTSAALAMVSDLLADPRIGAPRQTSFRNGSASHMGSPCRRSWRWTSGWCAWRSDEGRLVELQAFPSLYGFQLLLAKRAGTCGARGRLNRAGRPRSCDVSPDGWRGIVHGHDPREVVLMEIDPAHQKTRPDFAATNSCGVSVPSTCVTSIARAPAVLRPRWTTHADSSHLQPRDPRRRGATEAGAALRLSR
jgi:hypothetical protein